ncbi:hypothetical protein A2U01_0042654, partial [Trifolium medium]|nr:hypothetical protein [Trifolium medium]
ITLLHQPKSVIRRGFTTSSSSPEESQVSSIEYLTLINHRTVLEVQPIIWQPWSPIAEELHSARYPMLDDTWDSSGDELDVVDPHAGAADD